MDNTLTLNQSSERCPCAKQHTLKGLRHISNRRNFK